MLGTKILGQCSQLFWYDVCGHFSESWCCAVRIAQLYS
jgi:hypothetical protein